VGAIVLIASALTAEFGVVSTLRVTRPALGRSSGSL
jgi:hypothetical protein